MPGGSPLDVVLPEAFHVRAVRFLGATGDLWREAMGRGDEPLWTWARALLLKAAGAPQE